MNNAFIHSLGFDYQFNALDPSGKENELNTAFSNVMKQGGPSVILLAAQTLIPVLRFIVSPF